MFIPAVYCNALFSVFMFVEVILAGFDNNITPCLRYAFGSSQNPPYVQDGSAAKVLIRLCIL